MQHWGEANCGWISASLPWPLFKAGNYSDFGDFLVRFQRWIPVLSAINERTPHQRDPDRWISFSLPASFDSSSSSRQMTYSGSFQSVFFFPSSGGTGDAGVQAQWPWLWTGLDSGLDSGGLWLNKCLSLMQAADMLPLEGYFLSFRVLSKSVEKAYTI